MAGKWYLPFKRSRVNYENVGHLPYLLQHDIGFSGRKLYRPVEVSGSSFILKGNYGMTRKEAMDWIKGQGVKQNPRTRLKPNRLTPVAFTVKGKRHTGKAKLVGGKVKVYVTANVARKINPNKAKLSARDVLGRIGGGPLADFHELRSSQVDKLLDFASTEGYRKPANASGSKARMYYQSLVRRAERGD